MFMVFPKAWKCRNTLRELESLTTVIFCIVFFHVLQSATSPIFATLDSTTSAKPMGLMLEGTRGSMTLDAQSISATTLLDLKLCEHMGKCLLYESLMGRQLLHLVSAPLFFAYETSMANTNGSYWTMSPSFQKCRSHCCRQTPLEDTSHQDQVWGCL